MSAEKTEKAALVTGATGFQGRALVEILDADKKEWAAVYAVSRHPLDYEVKRTKHIRLDLSDKDAVKQVLKDDKTVDHRIAHIFHLAIAGDTTNIDQSVAEWLKHVVEGAESTGHPLQHVFYEEGIKYYGCHWGPPKTPYREDDGRYLPPNFYYPAEDYLIARASSGAAWTWSTLRPGAIFGFLFRTKMNLLQVIAIYGAICKELGISMRYPGTAKTYYDTVQEAVDSKLLMHAVLFTSTHKGAANNACNCSNGPPLKVPLTTLMSKHQDTWRAIQLDTSVQFYKWFKELADRALIPRGPGYEKAAKLAPPHQALVELQRQP